MERGDTEGTQKPIEPRHVAKHVRAWRSTRHDQILTCASRNLRRNMTFHRTARTFHGHFVFLRQIIFGSLFLTVEEEHRSTEAEAWGTQRQLEEGIGGYQKEYGGIEEYEVELLE